jgi:hypothetical protein
MIAPLAAGRVAVFGTAEGTRRNIGGDYDAGFGRRFFPEGVGSP